ncbi:hypothetical protein B0J12DRAFT_60900 [Macrophomina phaseolina]|uniref:Uncharacterized protein n=1 Tax=Macrophomina phaseolina TaxID=35725 RepID=A0ABQ8GCE5_9PEZI|nr:hypothetical protein B0J12DRAFT_60900 [Macrophomina phaseolina]
MSRNARLLSFLKRQPKFWRCRQLTILALLSHLCSSLVSPRTFYRSLVPASPSADGNSKKNKPPQILVFPRPPCFIHVAESRALTLGAGGEEKKKKQIGRGRGPSRTTPCSPSCRQPHQRSVPGNPVTGSLFLIKQLWPTNRPLHRLYSNSSIGDLRSSHGFISLRHFRETKARRASLRLRNLNRSIRAQYRRVAITPPCVAPGLTPSK